MSKTFDSEIAAVGSGLLPKSHVAEPKYSTGLKGNFLLNQLEKQRAYRYSIHSVLPSRGSEEASN